MMNSHPKYGLPHYIQPTWISKGVASVGCNSFTETQPPSCAQTISVSLRWCFKNKCEHLNSNFVSFCLFQSGQTVSVDAKCDEPTLLGNVLDEIKQTFSQCWLCLTAPGCPPPTLHKLSPPPVTKTRHNHVTKHCGWHLQLCPIYYSFSFLSPLSALFLLSFMVTLPRARWSFYRL